MKIMLKRRNNSAEAGNGRLRELLVRTASGTAFVAGVVACTLISRWLTLAMIAIFMFLMNSEFIKITHTRKAQGILLHISSVLLLITHFLVQWNEIGMEWFFISAIPVCALLVSHLFVKDYNVHDGSHNGYADSGLESMALLYITVPALFCINSQIVEGTFSGKFLLSLFIMLWCCDVGAYCIGTMFGQKATSKKLFPSISPKKSWAGFWGGVACSIVSGALLWYTGLFHASLAAAIVISVIVAVGGVAGDLVESQFKRNFGVKDSGNIMPGHGGMLDRLDGALIAFPLAISTAMVYGII